jgi:hypothetical protein
MTAPDGRRELVSQGTRRAVRDLMSNTVLREIDQMWQDEKFAPGPEPDPPVGGQRVSLFQSYLDTVDWTDPGHVRRGLRVFEVALHDFQPENLTRVARLFERDGYRLVGGRITGGPVIVLREGVLSGLTDPAAIREHLDRIARAIEDDDAAQAIGSAKELIESTAKIVLHERGLPVDDKEDLPQLVRAAQVALAVHPASASPGPDGSDAVICMVRFPELVDQILHDAHLPERSTLPAEVTRVIGANGLTKLARCYGREYQSAP